MISVYLLRHLPQDVIDFVSEQGCQVLTTTPSLPTFIGCGRGMAVYPASRAISPDTVGTVILVYSLFSPLANRWFEFPFVNGVCTNKSYTHFTKNNTPLAPKIVNEIYLRCLKDLINNKDQTPSMIPPPQLIADLIHSGKILENQINMNVLQKELDITLSKL